MRTKRILQSALAIIMAAMMMLLASCDAAEDVSADGDNHLTRAEEEAEETATETEAKTEAKAEETTTKAAETTAAATTTVKETLPVKIRNNNLNIPVVDTYMIFNTKYNTPFNYIDDDNNFVSISINTGEKTVYEDVRDIYIPYAQTDENGVPTSAYILKTDNTLWAFGAYWTITETVEDSAGYMVEKNVPTTYENMVQLASDVASLSSSCYLTTNKELWDLRWSSDGIPVILSSDVQDLINNNIYLTDKGELINGFVGETLTENISEIVEYTGNVVICKSKTGELLYFKVEDYGMGRFGLVEISMPDSVKVVDSDRIIKSDNTLWARGSNDMGQLGDGTKTDREDFVKIADNVKEAIAGGYGYITMDNELYGWSPENAKHILIATLNNEYIVGINLYEDIKDRKETVYFKNENGNWSLYFPHGNGDNVFEISNTQGVNIRMPE
jgi:hypothetical protein